MSRQPAEPQPRLQNFSRQQQEGPAPSRPAPLLPPTSHLGASPSVPCYSLPPAARRRGGLRRGSRRGGSTPPPTGGRGLRLGFRLGVRVVGVLEAVVEVLLAVLAAGRLLDRVLVAVALLLVQDGVDERLLVLGVAAAPGLLGQVLLLDPEVLGQHLDEL